MCDGGKELEKGWEWPVGRRTCISSIEAIDEDSYVGEWEKEGNVGRYGEEEVVANDTEGRYPIPVPQNRKDKRNNSRTIDVSSKG